MRLLILRSGIALIGLAAVWLFAGRWCSSLIDRVYTVPLAVLPASPVGWNGTYLQFGATIGGTEGPKGGWNAPDLSVGSHILSLTGPGPDYRQPATLTVDPNNRLILTVADRGMVLGIRAGTMQGGDGAISAYTAEPGDTASMTLERSWLSWRTPFEMNFMTGYTHSWRRHLYYRLTWTKASGEHLDMLWHSEQGFHRDDGWNPAGGDESNTGLIRAEIRSAH